MSTIQIHRYNGEGDGVVFSDAGGPAEILFTDIPTLAAASASTGSVEHEGRTYSQTDLAALEVWLGRQLVCDNHTSTWSCDQPGIRVDDLGHLICAGCSSAAAGSGLDDRVEQGA